MEHFSVMEELLLLYIKLRECIEHQDLDDPKSMRYYKEARMLLRDIYTVKTVQDRQPIDILPETQKAAMLVQKLEGLPDELKEQVYSHLMLVDENE